MEKYYYNVETEEISKGIYPYKEITKEEYYAIDYARRYSKGLYRNFENISDFTSWCIALGLDQKKTKDAFLEIGHPMDFVTSIDIRLACEELDMYEKNSHWFKDFRDGKISVDDTWEILFDKQHTDIYLI